METPQQQAWRQHMNTGKQCFQRGDLPGAVLAFDRATKYQPDRVEAWVNLGSALLQGGHADDAGEALRTALAVNPRIMATHMLLGDVQRLQGQGDEALSSYRQAVALERSPIALNKLACALRARLRSDEAQELYEEALQIEPRFSLARVNLATLQLERGDYIAAEEELTELEGVNLAPTEQAEIAAARLALAEHKRLQAAIDSMNWDGDTAPLAAALADLPRPLRRVDDTTLSNCPQYITSARELRDHPALKLRELPLQWPAVEAQFTFALATDTPSYLQASAALTGSSDLDDAQLAAHNMVPVIEAARGCRQEMDDPVSAELQLRRWHGMACRGIRSFKPGHFKYTRNWSAEEPRLKRVDPPLASATLQHFLREYRPQLKPGLLQAATQFLVMCDLQCFADGNTRIALAWMNRELEWHGLMPALFPSELGMAGTLGSAMRAVHGDPGNLGPLLAVIVRGQEFASNFCEELAAAEQG